MGLWKREIKFSINFKLQAIGNFNIIVNITT